MFLRDLRDPRDRLPLPGVTNSWWGGWTACLEPAFHEQTDQSKALPRPPSCLTLTHPANIPPALINSGPGTRQLGTTMPIAQSLLKLFKLTNPTLYTFVCLVFPIETPIKAVVYAFPLLLLLRHDQNLVSLLYYVVSCASCS